VLRKVVAEPPERGRDRLRGAVDPRLFDQPRSGGAVVHHARPERVADERSLSDRLARLGCQRHG